MDILAILAELYGQRDRISQAIEALESLDGTKTLGDGHDLPPPLGTPAASVTLTAGRRSMSPAARKKIGAAQKARWAAKKKLAKPVAGAKPVAPNKAAPRKAKRVVSSESRKKMAEAQQKRWANRKQAAKAAAKKAAAPVATALAKEAVKT